LHQEDRGGFADVVGAAFEGEAEHAEIFAAQRPQGAADFSKKARALLFVDVHDFIEQAEVVAAFPGDGAEGEDVFGKAGAAVADAGVQKAASDARIRADALADLIHVRTYGLADRGHGVDEGNLHGQERIGRVLDEFGALAAGHENLWGDGSTIRRGNCVGALVVAAVGHGSIDLA